MLPVRSNASPAMGLKVGGDGGPPESAGLPDRGVFESNSIRTSDHTHVRTRVFLESLEGGADMRRPGGSGVWLQHMASELLIHSSLFLDQDGWPTPHTPTIIGDRRRESESGGTVLLLLSISSLIHSTKDSLSHL